MKRSFATLIALSIVLLTNTSKAQIVVPDDMIKSSSVTFLTKSISKDSFVVVDTENEYFNQTPKLAKFPAASFVKRNHTLIQAFTSVFNKNRLQTLYPELTMGINYYVNSQTGNVEEVTFLFRKNTELTVAELQKLEYELMRLVVFKVTPQLKQNKEIVILTQNVPYRKIVDSSIDF